jgi:hypothetical protein
LLEQAMLLSRRHFLDPSLLQAEFEKHRIIVEKTAGDRELQALSLVRSALELPPL